MKNHEVINGKLLQTNKTFSQLKMKQKDWIVTEFYRLYHEKMRSCQTVEKLDSKERDEVIHQLYEKIEERDIWIPFLEVKKWAYSKTAKAVKSFKPA